MHQATLACSKCKRFYALPELLQPVCPNLACSTTKQVNKQLVRCSLHDLFDASLVDLSFPVCPVADCNLDLEKQCEQCKEWVLVKTFKEHVCKMEQPKSKPETVQSTTMVQQHVSKELPLSAKEIAELKSAHFLLHSPAVLRMTPSFGSYQTGFVLTIVLDKPIRSSNNFGETMIFTDTEDLEICLHVDGSNTSMQKHPTIVQTRFFSGTIEQSTSVSTNLAGIQAKIDPFTFPGAVCYCTFYLKSKKYSRAVTQPKPFVFVNNAYASDDTAVPAAIKAAPSISVSPTTTLGAPSLIYK